MEILVNWPIWCIRLTKKNPAERGFEVFYWVHFVLFHGLRTKTIDILSSISTESQFFYSKIK